MIEFINQKCYNLNSDEPKTNLKEIKEIKKIKNQIKKVNLYKRNTKKVIDNVLDIIYAFEGIIFGGFIRDELIELLPGENLLSRRNNLSNINCFLDKNIITRFKNILNLLLCKQLKICELKHNHYFSIHKNSNKSENVYVHNISFIPILTNSKEKFLKFSLNIIGCDNLSVNSFINPNIMENLPYFKLIDMTTNILFKNKNFMSFINLKDEFKFNCFNEVDNILQFVNNQIKKKCLTILPINKYQTHRSKDDLQRIFYRVKKMIQRGWGVKQELNNCPTFVLTKYGKLRETFPLLDSNNDEKLKRVLNEKECSISKNEFSKNTYVVVTHCMHGPFCAESFEELTKNSNSECVYCPICRTKLL